MIRNAYLMKVMGIQPRTVIHVGSHLAQDQRQYELLGVESIFWCEADPECCNVIAKKYPTSNVIEGFFWSKENEEIDFWIMRDRAQNSAFSPRNANTFLSKRKVISTTLDAQFADAELLSPILLVVDVQGAEIEVLEGGRKFLSSVDYVVCEITDMSSVSNFEVKQSKVENFLSEFSFLPSLKRVSYDKEYFDLLLIKGNFIRIKKVQAIDLLFSFLKKIKNLLKGILN
jgi:FkbM family methyltransferase